MKKRYLTVWFRHLTTDWLTLRRPELKTAAFVFAAHVQNRKMITAANREAELLGISPGMPVADARAMTPDLLVFDEKPELEGRLLKKIGEWSIRYTPIVAVDHPDGLVLDITGCAHLWGGEGKYLKEIISRLRNYGYDVTAAIADTIGCAWAVTRFGPSPCIVDSGETAGALTDLPAAALRLEPAVLQRLSKLGLYRIGSFIGMPRTVLRRRFGSELLLRIAQALGQAEEYVQPLQVPPAWQERLPCLEPIRTRTGIEIAVRRLLELLCSRLQQDGKGLRSALLKCYRVDGRIIQTAIGTSRASHHTGHLCKLFELKIGELAPGLGIELFVLDALKVEDVSPVQEGIWAGNAGLDQEELAELLDRLENKVGKGRIHRYLPDEHYWPERSVKEAGSLQQAPAAGWRNEKPRPVDLLRKPEPIEVSAPIPDYPPMVFLHKGERHQIVKADGPERIEREWWLESGEHRDYYQVEDQHGQRYWLFRSGHYAGGEKSQWFLHGYFA